MTCRNCGRAADAHDDAWCASVHLGGMPRPPRRDPADPTVAPALSLASAEGEVLVTGAIRPVRFVASRELAAVAVLVDGRCVGRITVDAARAALDALARALEG